MFKRNKKDDYFDFDKSVDMDEILEENNEEFEEYKISRMKKILKFLLIFLLTLTIVIVFGYIYLDQKFKDGVYEERSKTDYSITSDRKNVLNNKKEFNEAINVLILGTDDGGYRSDVAMLVHYDPYTKTTSLFSIPRDYKISLSTKAQEDLNYYAPYMKFNEIFAYCIMAEVESPSSYVTQVVEEMLNININHFVLVDLDSFKAAVDAVDGVEVYVPQRMYWDDPYQDLHIDLQAGVQLLDGGKAEQLVRYRQTGDGSGYGDFGRIQMQQYFLTAFAKKLLSINSITKIKQIIEPISEMLTTDASLADAIWILNTGMDADFNRVNAHTMPGADSYIGGIYYFSPPSDEEVKRYFIKTVLEDAESFDQDSTEYTIDVYSSTKKQSEKAENLVNTLLQDGYTAEFKGIDYSQRILKSLIIVPDTESGGDLKKYLDLSEIRVDENMTENTDKKVIRIVVGEVQAE